MNNRNSPIRLGLCCLFNKEPIRFKTHRATHLLQFSRDEQLGRLSQTVYHNSWSLHEAVLFCIDHSIGCFRINSRFLPLKTHPDAGYGFYDLPEHEKTEAVFSAIAELARKNDIRLTFHPDQFTLLSSSDSGITARSVEELVYHTELAERLGADVITLHGGGAYGDKQTTLRRIERNIEQLPLRLRDRLALENDDRIYTPEDLLPLCRRTNIPLVYDVHHHRCNPDNLSITEASKASLSTWNREPLFHLSSPQDGWNGGKHRPHHDYIQLGDFPEPWKKLKITVEVEAKAKEEAVLQLQRDLQMC
jgi:UV DNA damage endonuclease